MNSYNKRREYSLSDKLDFIQRVYHHYHHSHDESLLLVVVVNNTAAIPPPLRQQQQPPLSLRQCALQVASKYGISASTIWRWVLSEDLLKEQQEQVGNMNSRRLPRGKSMVYGGRKAPSPWPPMQDSLEDVTVNVNGRPFKTQFHPDTVSKCEYPAEEAELYRWFVNQRNAGIAVSCTMLRRIMLSLVQDSLMIFAHVATNPLNSSRVVEKREKFKASSGWLAGFFERYNLSVQIVTTLRTATLKNNKNCKTRVDDLVEWKLLPDATPRNRPNKNRRKAFRTCLVPDPNHAREETKVEKEFKKFLTNAYDNNNFTRATVWNMDETRLYFDMPPKTTVHFRNAQPVVVATTGNSDTGFSVALTCSADGALLKPMVIFKGSRTGPLSKTEPAKIAAACGGEDKIKVIFTPKAAMDEQVMLDEYLPMVKDMAKNNKVLLCMDALRAHRTDNVKNFCKSNSLHLGNIPAGFTSTLQPLDVGIIKPFKDNVTKCWNQWINSKQRELSLLSSSSSSSSSSSQVPENKGYYSRGTELLLLLSRTSFETAFPVLQTA